MNENTRVPQRSYQCPLVPARHPELSTPGVRSRLDPSLALGDMTIPAKLHFCWIGPSLPWAYAFAVLSAAERSELPEIILHHTDVLEDGREIQALKQEKRVQLSQIEPITFLTKTAACLGLDDLLVKLYQRLDSPVMRSDVLRAAILYMQGGIYADLDTITVSSLLPLTAGPTFVGSEFIVWPRSVRTSRSVLLLGRHLVLDLMRKLCRSVPDGWRLFKRLEPFYSLGINNAVMGAEARSPLLAAYLRAMVELPRERQSQPYALGPHLLGDTVAQDKSDTLVIQEPHVFYPLAPEISEHWFRTVRNVSLAQALPPETCIVHWYASVRTRSKIATIDPRYITNNQGSQLYSALVSSCIGGVSDLT